MSDYFMGLDMGTGSLGWALTDTEYRLCRAHGKDLWGIRLFENADTAEERRIFRCGRRRLDRRNRRIQLLQQIFAEEVSAVDPGFFLRLKESRYVPEDKRDLEGKTPQLPYALFVDKDYTDKDFYKEYPTIYHLRKRLMEDGSPKDVRLVYLALHHIIKHRGHFLFAGIDAQKMTDLASIFVRFKEVMEEQELDFYLEIDEEKCSYIKEVLEDKRLTKKGKASRLIQDLQAKTDCEKAILRLLTGCKVKLSAIFNDRSYEENERSEISFSEADYDEYKEMLELELEDRYIIIATARAIYDQSILAYTLGGAQTLSEAKVCVYEKHREDLQKLKKLVKRYLTRQEYKEIFIVSDKKKNNYPAYIGMTKINGRKVGLDGKRCSKEDFYKFLKKEVVARIENESVREELDRELELGTFLPKQSCKDNSVIPYQIQLMELKKIIENAGQYLPFLKENAEKIEKIFVFRVPYYVGPLNFVNEGNATFSWAVRRSDRPVYPWNFEEVIDVEASAEKFIRHMTNKCTYLPAEDVLPKASLLYSKFLVLNELNDLRIDGDKLSVGLKQELYEKLFMRYRKVTIKKLRDYLVQEGYAERTIEISGIDGDFKASLRSYHDLKEKLTGVKISEEEKEKLILNITLFGADKILLKKRVRRLFPDLTDGQIKAICTLNYNGWGRLSKKFLEGIETMDTETGEMMNIIRMLWETNDDLMQLLSSRYGFMQALQDVNDDGETKGFTYETVEKLHVSPAVKRQIWQTLLVVRELQKEMGKDPKRVFLEVAREKQRSIRTVSRKKTLQELYRKCRQEERDWIGEIENRDEHTFKSDRLFLYYTQKGKCMYCEKEISLQELWDANIYDIDHIYPQSKIMDDSIRNRVLTCKICNQQKEDRYPIKADIRHQRHAFWKGLKECGLIDGEKYKRLTRTEEFSPSELAGFIERQLVETRQSTKAVADILKKAMPNTEIVYVKAKTVSAFRQDFGFTKVRELNDYHHGKDAYLNIVVGNTYFVKFTKNAAWFIEQNPGRSYNLKKMFTSEADVKSHGETAWRAGNSGTIVTVRKMMKKNSLLFTRKSHEAQGGLFDQQLMKKGKGQVPIKSSDERLLSIEKYGGYNKATTAYFVLVASEGKRGAIKKTIECVPIYRKKELEKDENKLLEYLEKEVRLKKPRILLKKIKIDDLFKVDGFKMHLSSRTDDRLVFKGSEQLFIDGAQEKRWAKIAKIVMQIKRDRTYKINEFDQIEDVDVDSIYEMFIDKLKKPPYDIRFCQYSVFLEHEKDVFLNATLERKCIILNDISCLFQCNSRKVDLSSIGGSKQIEKLRINKDITKCKQISIIYQSPSGIYEKEVDLSKI